MQQVTVTIGRNVGSKPLDSSIWDEFRNQAATLIRSLNPSVVFHFDGVGEWEGVSEESRHFVALFGELAPNAQPSGVSDGSFHAELGNLARIFAQDAIAWSFGHSTLAEPNPVMAVV